MPVSRRTLLTLGGLAAVALGVPRLLQRSGPLPDARPIPGLPGYRRLSTGPVSGTGAALIGLDDGPRPDAALLARLQADPAAALFGSVPAGAMPVAIFTDVNCSNCRVMAPVFAELAARRDMHVVWHELPLLGPTSVLAARAVLAAAPQGGSRALHDLLMRSRLRPSPAGVAQVAETAGLDPERLLADMDHPRIDTELERSAALAWLFGVPGTPAMVLNRTLVIGALDGATLRRLLRRV